MYKKIILVLCIFTPYLQADIPKDVSKWRAMYQKDSKEWQKPLVDDGVEWEEIGALPDMPPYPESNHYSKEKVALGEKLFNDPRLSISNQIACANCHDRELGFSDGRSKSYGHDRAIGKRNAPSVAMSAFGNEKFWDGRAENLEIQSLMPIADPKEMAFTPEKAAKKLNKIKSYKQEFQAVFGTDTITPELIAKAIATYERSLMPKNSRFDRFIKGNTKALNDKEVWGLHIFRTKARCMNCHHGVAFSDQKFHNIGLSYYGSKKHEDLGRYEITKNQEDIGKFKTPSLRGVTKTAPYMHNGLFPILIGVLRMYNMGIPSAPLTKEQENDPLFPKTDKLIHKLNLTLEELEALEAFLRTL